MFGVFVVLRREEKFGLERRIQFKVMKIVCSLLIYIQRCKTSFLQMILLFLYLFRFTTDSNSLLQNLKHTTVLILENSLMQTYKQFRYYGQCYHDILNAVIQTFYMSSVFLCHLTFQIVALQDHLAQN
jgi:hypothetical protein